MPRKLTSGGLLAPLLIVLAACFVYSPAWHGAWLWDDKGEIPHNAALKIAAGLGEIWFAPKSGDYYPLKTSVQWVQWHLWGDETLGYHLTNVALHVLGAFLFWRLLALLGVRWAWTGGLLFVVHPIAVESVAWIDELKNTLSLPFLLLAMIAYIDTDTRWSALSPTRSPDSVFSKARWGQRAPPGSYFLSVLFFLLAMLSKASVAMFPLVLLLHAWWRRGRIGPRDLAASAAFFAISLVLGIVAVDLQAHRAIGVDAVIPMGTWIDRTAGAGLAMAFYLFKCVIPAGLMPIYPRWPVDGRSPLEYLPWVALAAVLAFLWRRRTGWGRHAIFGLGWFLLNLAPVLGFVTISHMRFTWAMDHLAYVPLLGLLGLAAAGAGAIEDRLPSGGRLCAAATLAVICAFLAVAGRRYAATFRDEATFWTSALERNPAAWLAHNNLGNVLLGRGQNQAAVAHFEQALRLHPDYAEAEYNLGLARATLGELPSAVDHYEAALLLRPGYVDALNNLGNALLRMDRLPEAIGRYAEALRLQPRDVQAQCNLGVALMREGRGPEAILAYQAALRIDPDYPAAHVNLGNALALANRAPEAVAEFEAAARLMPDDPDLHFNLGTALMQAGRQPDAMDQFREVIRLRPDDAEALAILRRAGMAQGR